MQEAEGRVNELTQKEAFQRTQIEELSQEAARCKEELRLARKESESNAKADTDKADLRDKFMQLQQENKVLKKEMETRFTQDGLMKDEEIGDLKREKMLLENKNRQLEGRLDVLEGKVSTTELQE